ncbi:MAG: tRNA (guanosine(37)-N1)-methyltransferase TrmD [SAR86 cluster bacterium]|uniref:tRNA (guanine-N(1)-)-methyltransferase n=1 Tax=SAR86 cluster bacterium TaxID=2030880 RepID=A0A2A5AWP7_9GAMM|nr:MAG: tRNA (guanosine(37)-N1)-methyltransferase TrmD [SAR86 cluster bacterium]
MQIGLVTLFPEMFSAVTEHGISGRAFRSGLIELACFNPRDYTTDKHRTVDDKPFGGGPGMIMKTEPLLASIKAAKQALEVKQKERHKGKELSASAKSPKVIYLSPQGKALNQKRVIELAQLDSMVMVCGRYQGIDDRVVATEIDEEISLGDFVISGGEIAAMALIDAITRFQPGALGDENSAQQDSFSAGLLHCPEYTRPQSFAGQDVPEVLLSGDHEAIRLWRLKQSLGVTWLKRPDLLKAVALNKEQESLLEQFKIEHNLYNKL